MDYYLLQAAAPPLEARITVVDGRVTLHSRSGRARTDPPESRGRNPDYVAAFDTLFDRLARSGSVIARVLLDSTPARAAAEVDRVLATQQDFETIPLESVKNQIRRKMRAFGRSSDMPANEGNQNKKILIETKLGDGEIVDRLQLTPIADAAGTDRQSVDTAPILQVAPPLPARELRQVGRVHVAKALQRIDDGDPAERFQSAPGYDVMTGDGQKYSPSKVFGLALEEALGVQVSSASFGTGWGTPCFDVLEACGLWIVPRPGSASRPRAGGSGTDSTSTEISPTDEERTWIEGNPRIAVHLRKERHPGLAARKRAQFILEHGSLRCERCDLDPVEAYGEEAGQACIEVHHHRTHVADMQSGHETSLDDLKCLCSNCHRVLHRALSMGLPFDV